MCFTWRVKVNLRLDAFECAYGIIVLPKSELAQRNAAGPTIEVRHFF